MPSIINSTSTGVGGLISTGNTDNELVIQTGDTTAISIDASQNVVLTNALPVASGGTGVTTSTGTGNVVLSANPLFTTLRETATIAATAATGTINYDAITQSVLYYTTDASGNWTLNIRGDSGTSLDSIMSTGQSLTVTFLVTNGATAYYQTAFQIDGSSVTPEWQGGSAPSAGNVSSVDSYTFAIIKTGSATFTVFGSLTQFA